MLFRIVFVVKPQTQLQKAEQEVRKKAERLTRPFLPVFVAKYKFLAIWFYNTGRAWCIKCDGEVNSLIQRDGAGYRQRAMHVVGAK